MYLYINGIIKDGILLYVNLLGLIGGGFVLDFGGIGLVFVDDFLLVNVFMGNGNVIRVWLIEGEFDLFVFIVVIGS